MDLQRSKQELVEMVNQIQSAQQLSALKEVVSDFLSRQEDSELSSRQKAILDERIDKYRSGKGKMYTWEEVVDRVRK